MEFLRVLGLGWVGSLIGLIGLIGLIITFLLYRASRIGPRLVYQYKALRLIWREEQALPEQVTILFKDKKVQRLTKTHIILWNSGKATVNGENIVADDPLRLEFSEDSDVLGARVLNFTRKSNKFTVNINPRSPNEVILRFDYLDAGDGAVLELLHTAEEFCPKVHGSIRSIPKGLLSWGRISLSIQERSFTYRPKLRTKFGNKSFKASLVMILCFGMFLIAYGFLGPIISESFMFARDWLRWFLVLIGLIITFVFSLGLWMDRRRFPKSLSIQDIEW